MPKFKNKSALKYADHQKIIRKQELTWNKSIDFFKAMLINIIKKL